MRGGRIQRVGRPKLYRIVLDGELGERFANEFEGMILERGSGKTFLRGEIVDRSHLHWVLNRIEDLGLDLVSITEVHEGPGARRTEE